MDSYLKCKKIQYDTTMKRIAFIHNNFPAGGAERITIDIARYLHGIGGYEVYVYATRFDEKTVSERFGRFLTVRRIPSQAIPSRRAKEIERHVLDDRIGVLVQVSKSLPGIDGIRKRTGCRTVVACHGEPFWQRHMIVHRRQKGFLRRLMWYLFNKRRYADGSLAMKMAVERTLNDYNNCDAYTVLCQSYKREVADVLGLDLKTCHIWPIENPEPAVADLSLAKEKMFLFCGRFENWSKRIDRLLRIWSKVQSHLPEWSLVLVGDGHSGRYLREMADELGLERVYFEGMQKDVARYYRQAWAVCMTSETEGWPLALTEGQAHGCIGIAFGCTSGVKEILSPDGGCGFIVPPYDEDLYAEVMVKVACLSEEEEMRIRLNGVEKRLEYVPDVINEKWRSLFDSLYMSGNIPTFVD